MRRTLLVSCCLLTAACFHDNASPFVHGAKNAPSLGGATHVSAAGGSTETTGTSGYGGSSGEAGGIDKQYGSGNPPPPVAAAASPAPQVTQTRQAAPAGTAGAVTGTAKP